MSYIPQVIPGWFFLYACSNLEVQLQQRLPTYEQLITERLLSLVTAVQIKYQLIKQTFLVKIPFLVVLKVRAKKHRVIFNLTPIRRVVKKKKKDKFCFTSVTLFTATFLLIHVRSLFRKRNINTKIF